MYKRQVEQRSRQVGQLPGDAPETDDEQEDSTIGPDEDPGYGYGGGDDGDTGSDDDYGIGDDGAEF